MVFGWLHDARAEEPTLDTADGLDACRDFEAKNARELADWQKQQPSVPYQYPPPDVVLGAPWGPFLKGLGSTGELLVASVVPHFGAQFRGDTPAATISWPWSLPIGPALTCSRRQGSFTVQKHRPNRLLFEPGIVSSNRGTGLFVRLGYRFLYHPSDWVVGVGGGLGSTAEITGNREPFRLSLGPEAVLQFGHCCDSGYFTLTARYDHFFAGEVRDTVGGNLGFVYF
ncbi:hypothetical protein AKJ09_03353 [Labilithrix luteola]|uniref:Outer membrane protein beta-barrel domain-containing protein n=1 Tax=Labilithrix luteola TaxID=1391654 RepID=A0A0K1PU86_9BACT|nr:hypothetical protein [Labilithrix luteola]AKU96689.1 hypothetical protein AKJ09_03353 [Labilithrix luteola]